MQIQVNFRSSLPIYEQIVEQIRQLIATGALKPNDHLPTVRQLAADLRINFNTVARAYRILDEAGLISTQHGRGTYVWERPTEETTRKLRRQSMVELTHRYINDVTGLGYNLAEAIQIMHENWPDQNDHSNN